MVVIERAFVNTLEYDAVTAPYHAMLYRSCGSVLEVRNPNVGCSNFAEKRPLKNVAVEAKQVAHIEHQGRDVCHHPCSCALHKRRSYRLDQDHQRYR
jgi:hypothetical protein